MNTNSIRIIQSEKYIETHLVTIVYSVIPFNVHPLTKDTIVTDQLGTNSSSPGRFLSNRFLTKAYYFLGSRVSFESSNVILPGLSPTFVEINTDWEDTRKRQKQRMGRHTFLLVPNIGWIISTNIAYVRRIGPGNKNLLRSLILHRCDTRQSDKATRFEISMMLSSTVCPRAVFSYVAASKTLNRLVGSLSRWWSGTSRGRKEEMKRKRDDIVAQGTLRSCLPPLFLR